MRAYEFPAWITETGDLQLPEIAKRALPRHRRVRVLILLADEADCDPSQQTAESVLTWQSPSQIPYDGI